MGHFNCGEKNGSRSLGVRCAGNGKVKAGVVPLSSRYQRRARYASSRALGIVPARPSCFD